MPPADSPVALQITFALPMLTQARSSKRIAALRRLGVRARLACFERTDYPGSLSGEQHVSLGRIRHGNYLRRVPALLRAAWRLRRASRSADVIYAYGLDLLGLAYGARLLSRRSPQLVYEVGDVKKILVGDRLVSRLLRACERFLVRRCGQVVVTSQAYIDHYFHAIQGLTESSYHLIENKLDPKTFTATIAPRSAEPPFRIGYFGVLRCVESWRRLRELASDAPEKFKVTLRGIALNRQELVDGLKHPAPIEYGGPFSHPADLDAMYGAIDFGWVAHRHCDVNTSWARANRFYECCLYRVPMIAQEGTQDGEIVERLDLGLLIDVTRAAQTRERLLQVTAADWARWRANLERLPKQTYLYDAEHERLVQALAEAV